MADNVQFQTSRVQAGSMGSSVDNDFANMENAMRTVFGATADADISAISTIGAGPDMTLLGTLTLAGDPTSDLMACTKQFVDNATGGDASSICAAVYVTIPVKVAAGNTVAVSFDAAWFEDGGDCWAAGNPTRLTAPEGGYYCVQGVVPLYGDVASAEAAVSIKRNGSTWLYTHISHGKTAEGAGYYTGAPFMFLEPLNLGDYIEVYVTAIGNDTYYEVVRLSWFKVG
jgi:hypothetical protein